MDILLLDEIVKSEKRTELSSVVDACFNLEGLPYAQLILIAKDVNEKLGCKLFDNMEQGALVKDFSTVKSATIKEIFDSAKLKNENIERALLNNIDVLEEVVEMNKKMPPHSNYEVIAFAHNVNERLGFELFPDIYYRTLVRHFEKVATAVEIYKKDGTIIKYSPKELY